MTTSTDTLTPRQSMGSRSVWIDARLALPPAMQVVLAGFDNGEVLLAYAVNDTWRERETSRIVWATVTYWMAVPEVPRSIR